jgi:hypothetical protein
MPENYVLLETISLTQSAASITFDNIPQTGYTDLKIVASARTNRALEVDSAVLRFNGDNTSGNYTGRRIYGTGSSVGSDTNPAGLFTTGANATSDTYGNSEVYISRYLSGNQKTFVFENTQENNASTSYIALQANNWSGTAAIYQIVLTPEVGTSFNAGSTFSLYGVAALGTTPAVAPKATGGNIVANDGTYWYHAFLTSGIFIPQTGLNCDVLTVAGGGGGGATRGGGGGAGGAFAATTFVSTPQGVIVGSGGGGGATTAGGGGYNGTNGTNSQFGSLTAAVGGGFGIGNDGYTGASGSGGSSGGTVLWGGTLGTAVSGQGFVGGRNTVGYLVGGGAGGGGGAGAVGAGTTNNNGGNGGAGLNTWSTWLTATNTGVNGFIAGGGGGATSSNSGTPGTGGSGGGGAGGLIANGTSAIPNTGGGGGGGGRHDASGTAYAGGNGGSGLVIVRYLIG